ncbi:Uncharacterised protein [Bordetella ansorpii]|uniref:Uncharacterized protein n=1 Tax=Bordetella ansorpii TaxID=288768 RepID=A0A157P592_9BORD|nr:hypothetical protein [Bordetella ansorpii]SAI28540.1 Uncharacterised protein [Bordetella ansorpii]
MRNSLFDVQAAASDSTFARLKRIDARRPDFPGEHLVVLGLGLLLMRAGMRGTTLLRRTLFSMAGTALIGRAASGTGGISRLARVLKHVR